MGQQHLDEQHSVSETAKMMDACGDSVVVTKGYEHVSNVFLWKHNDRPQVSKIMLIVMRHFHGTITALSERDMSGSANLNHMSLSFFRVKTSPTSFVSGSCCKKLAWEYSDPYIG